MTTATRKQVQEGFFSLMAQATRQWRRVLDRELQPLGLTEATWLALLHLSRAPEPMRQKDLALSLALDNSSVVRLLDSLEAAGLAQRTEHADRRAKAIGLTPLGVDTVAQVEGIAMQARKRMLSVVPAADLDTAFRVLGQISEALAAAQEQALQEAAA